MRVQQQAAARQLPQASDLTGELQALLVKPRRLKEVLPDVLQPGLRATLGLERLGKRPATLLHMLTHFASFVKRVFVSGMGLERLGQQIPPRCCTCSRTSPASSSASL